MSSSVAMSVRKSRSRVIRPVSTQLAVIHTSNQGIWRGARHGLEDKTEHSSRSFNKYQREPETRHHGNATPNDTHLSWSWAAWRSQSSFSGPPGGRERRLWDSDLGPMHKHMEFLRKYIEADPYKAVFERRLEPFQEFGKNDTSLNGFLQSLSSMEKPSNDRPRVGKRQRRTDTNHAGLQYDPISGRMVPIPSSTAPESSNTEAGINFHKAFDCPPGTEVEAKFAHSPNLTGNGQFQPGNTRLSPKAPLNSQPTGECSPGSELDALVTSTPISQDVQSRARVEQKPHVNMGCPPGSELEPLFVSEPFPSARPRPSVCNDNGDTNKLDAGLTEDTNVECSPGSELEAKFITDPASRSVQSSPSALATQTPNKQIGFSIDCSPGNELDAKFSSELAGLSLQSAGSVLQNTNAASMTDPQESFECSSGSKIKAHILSKMASQGSSQLGDDTSIDCPPGSELEAKFVCNPASFDEMKSRPEQPSNLVTSKIAKNIADCTPGNELEAKLNVERASAEDPNEIEDLSPLDTDIPLRYTPFELKVQTTPSDFDTFEDRDGDLIFQSRNLGTETREQPAAFPSPKFHILAFDTLTSQVTAAQADSFFGVDEDSRPSEILSRLHNPAKFLPYFEKMQEGGYEIATGGGNILVFRKAQSTPHYNPSNTTADQEPEIHTEIAKYIRHDSIDSSATYAGAPWQSTAEPPATPPSSSEPERTSTSESSFRKTGRRILIASTATVATCYAVGVMTEFFRTGGKDGRGIDGFTVFESDRRRQE
ncbi:hypothetical protein N7491_002259 [Penicillium cf. griseofulvum]|uniref:Uncharacterized protein n=1 Tax=Penicillium cf. griseofulvum TaxID=2972120 RepID=A0A9W9T2J0_9EURO|nr:hypothetical protein N7472_003557 [Penicillium cf. griseofulvum]KAJ5446177.1 hypothetical protein N7491_002259 [Penicillium cf. griseofulvum]KAJ5447919.1 hypothetical protein N7445_002740 [Penicillium cf. griseofulvum]